MASGRGGFFRGGGDLAGAIRRLGRAGQDRFGAVADRAVGRLHRCHVAVELFQGGEDGAAILDLHLGGGDHLFAVAAEGGDLVEDAAHGVLGPIHAVGRLPG